MSRQSSLTDPRTPIFPKVKIDRHDIQRGDDPSKITTRLEYSSIVRVTGKDEQIYLTLHRMMYEFPQGADTAHILQQREEMLLIFIRDCYKSIHLLQLPSDMIVNEDGDPMYPLDEDQTSEKDRLKDLMNGRNHYQNGRIERHRQTMSPWFSKVEARVNRTLGFDPYPCPRCGQTVKNGIRHAADHFVECKPKNQT